MCRRLVAIGTVIVVVIVVRDVVHAVVGGMKRSIEEIVVAVETAGEVVRAAVVTRVLAVRLRDDFVQRALTIEGRQDTGQRHSFEDVGMMEVS